MTDSEVLTHSFWSNLHSSKTPTHTYKMGKETVKADESMLDARDTDHPEEKPIAEGQPTSMKHRMNSNSNTGSINGERDWSLPVSKFLQGFRVQAAASLGNAYQ